MEDARPDPWLSQLMSPLLLRFGDRLTLDRHGADAVRWCYAGNSAVARLLPGGVIAARFISRPQADRGAAVCAVYASPCAAYPLTAPGVERMVEDLADFFSGVREPRFTFVDALCEGAG